MNDRQDRKEGIIKLETGGRMTFEVESTGE